MKNKDIQKFFCDYVFNHFINDIDNNFIKSELFKERLMIYKNIILNKMLNCLSITFPGTWLILGRDFANSIASNFCAEISNAPVSLDINEWGNDFILYLENIIKKQKDLAFLFYLPQFMIYEWHKNIIELSNVPCFLPITEMQFILQNDYNIAKIIFVPSFTLLQFNFEIDKLIDLIENNFFNSQKITINNRNLWMILYKQNIKMLDQIDSNIKIIYIDKATYLFLNDLKQGNSIVEAFDKIYTYSLSQNEIDQFNLEDILVFLLQKQLIEKILN